MVYRIIRISIGLLFASLGVYLNYLLFMVIDIEQVWAMTGISFQPVWTYIVAGVLFAAIGYLLAPIFIRFFKRTTKWVENRLTKMPFLDLIGGITGLIIGLIIANFFNRSLTSIPIFGPVLAVVINIAAAYVGLLIGMKRRDDLLGIINFRRREKADKGEKNPKDKNVLTTAKYKILDTSVIIDGRIADVIRTGFIDGVFLVPEFVLDELQHIADSSDVLKRNRGRRGLDILNNMMKSYAGQVEISPQDFSDVAEVDSKLVRLAQTIKAPILTNDYNLNKVAEIHGVKVLNINELANSIKSILLPGEGMTVQVVKEGKEHGQGVAYLDDGTMVVVENGSNLIGQEIVVLVTTVLQTAAGRMIFAKVNEEREGLEDTLEKYRKEVNAFG